MVNDKEEVKKAFDRFLVQQAREQECHDDEVAVVVYDHLRATRYFYIILSTGRLKINIV